MPSHRDDHGGPTIRTVYVMTPQEAKAASNYWMIGFSGFCERHDLPTGRTIPRDALNAIVAAREFAPVPPAPHEGFMALMSQAMDRSDSLRRMALDQARALIAAYDVLVPA